MPDGSGARDVKPDRETYVRLYDQGASDPIKSRFLSATENSLMLQHEDGQAGTGGIVDAIQGIGAWIGPFCKERKLDDAREEAGFHRGYHRKRPCRRVSGRTEDRFAGGHRVLQATLRPTCTLIEFPLFVVSRLC